MRGGGYGECRVGSAMCDWGSEDSCWKTGYRCFNDLLCWKMKWQGGTEARRQGSSQWSQTGRKAGDVWREGKGGTTPTAQSSVSLNSTRCPFNPFCQNHNFQFRHCLIMGSIPPRFILGTAGFNLCLHCLEALGLLRPCTLCILIFFLFVAFSDINWMPSAYLY